MDGRQVNQERLEELLDVLGLRGREKYLPNQLSGGQQQRVSIGRALMNAPAVVLADEPTGNLDSKNSQEIVELLKMSKQEVRPDAGHHHPRREHRPAGPPGHRHRGRPHHTG